MDRVIHAVAPDAATIVFVEHDMEIVSRYADRVVAFYQGRILADGEPGHVLKDQEVRRYVTGARDERRQPLLEIDDLVVEIQSMPALRGFSMRIARGAMVSLVGRNGAGKTTLMRSIMGHLRPAQAPSGLKAPIFAAPAPCRAALGIGYMPEDRCLVPQLTVEENILLPLWVADISTARRGSTSSTG